MPAEKGLGGKCVYTPQVVLNGRDHRNWNSQRASSLGGLPPASAPALHLRREGQVVTATIASIPGPHVAGSWAVLQDERVSKVTRGENAGEDLRHDHVVSLYQPREPWAASQGGSARLTWPAGSVKRVAFVVTNSALTQPLQALVLQCPV